MRQSTYFLLATFIISFTLSGCKQSSIVEKMTSAEDEAGAKHYIELLQQNKFDEIERDLDPSIRGSDIHDILLKMAEMLPTQAPESIKTVGSHIMHTSNSRTANITFEYQYPDKNGF